MLIVDDETDTEFLFTQNFKDEVKSKKIALFFCKSAESCLEMLEQNKTRIHIILILSDINMPGINGFDLLKKITQTYPKTSVFMLISYGNIENTIKAWHYGAEEIIVKPLNFLNLKNLIADSNRLRQLKEKGIPHD
jgi:two-component system, response regulator, stage 0 sporulation protein F